MIEVGIDHNGALDLPLRVSKSDIVVAGGTLGETQESANRVLVSQVRQCILAEQLGYDYWFQTEHHFQPEGPECSPNPLIAEAAMAARTSRIRLGQMANIISWWHPIRIAEQAAMVDVISGGRLEFGVGRGYQPREAEVLGRPYGSTTQDQEKNRSYFEEAYNLIIKAWTEPSFSHHGEFFSIPPSWTKWNHPATVAYFGEGDVGRELSQVIKEGAPTKGELPIYSADTTVQEITVYPQPIQKPYPQIWQPVTTPRSIKWAAERGINGFFLGNPDSLVKRGIEYYYKAAEAAGWPDRLDGGEFGFAWDGKRRRGIGNGRFIHIIDKGLGDQERADLGLRLQWDYYSPFGFAAGLVEEGDPPYTPDMKVTPDLLREKEVALHGSVEHITEAILKSKEACGYGEDMLLSVSFELGGFEDAEIEEQMQCFAEEIMPVLRREFGGGPDHESHAPLEEPPRVASS